MQHLLTLFLTIATSAFTQTNKLELTPQGFLPLEIKSPNKPLDQLMQASKSWAPYYNKKGADVFDVTENSMSIEGRVENAYYSYNVGVKYNYDIVYKLKVVFDENKKYKLSISVKEIYAENVLTKITLADFFTAEGKLKDDFRDAKPSLENTVNRIANSYTKFIAQ